MGSNPFGAIPWHIMTLSSFGSPGCCTFRFGFVDKLCRIISMLGIFIRSLVGCLNPYIGFRRWLVILPICGVKCFSRLASALPLTLRCFGRIDFVFFDSYLVDIDFFDSCRFGFCFDGFVFGSTSGPFADSDSMRTSFSSAVCRSARSVQCASPSTPSVAISKETFCPIIFWWFRERMESSLKSTSLLRINV